MSGEGAKGEGSAGRRLGLLTIDQVISGASNVLIAVLAARLLSAEEFGLFGIVFLVYTLLIGVTRALVSDPLLVHPDEVEERTGEAIGATCVLVLPLSGLLILIALGLRGASSSLGDALIVLAFCLPLLALQDFGRYLGFATQRPGAAVLLDSVWLAVMLVSVTVVFSASDDRSLALFIAAWGGSGALAGLLLFAQFSIRAVRLNLAWLRYTWSLSWRYLVSYGSMNGSTLGVSSLVGAIAGTRALGGVQGALLLVRPFTTFVVAAVTHGIAEVARCVDDRRQIWKHVLVTSALGGAVAGLNLVVMLLLPTGAGEALLGDAWDPAEPLLLPTGLYIVFIGLISGPSAALMGLRLMREVTRINVVMGIVGVAAAGAGAAVDGATGAMWFAAGGQGVMMLVWWGAYWIRIRQEPAQAQRSLATVAP